MTVFLEITKTKKKKIPTTSYYSRNVIHGYVLRILYLVLVKM